MDGKNSHFALEAGGMLRDRYRIERLLGSNGLSITYEAFDTFREQKMIIKELFPEAIAERSKDDQRTVSCHRLVHENDFARMKEHMVREAKLLIQLYPLEGIANVITFLRKIRPFIL